MFDFFFKGTKRNELTERLLFHTLMSFECLNEVHYEYWIDFLYDKNGMRRMKNWTKDTLNDMRKDLDEVKIKSYFYMIPEDEV